MQVGYLNFAPFSQIGHVVAAVATVTNV